EDKADYDQNRFGITIGGPLNIPHVYHGGMKTFLFGNYIGTRGNNPYDVFSTVPSQAERSGDFSGSTTAVFDPSTHTQFANNQLSGINPASAALLKFIPLPNLPGTSRNFHFVSSSGSTADIAFVRFNHTFGADPGAMMGMFGGRNGGAGGGGARRQQRQQQQQQEQQKSADQKKSDSKSHWRQSI